MKETHRLSRRLHPKVIPPPGRTDKMHEPFYCRRGAPAVTMHIRRKLDSDMLYLPELRSLIGRNVEIIVVEEQAVATTPGTGDWDDAIKAVEELEDYDFDASRRQRECDLKHAKDHLR